MELIAWSNQLRVPVEIINSQHKEIIDSFNELCEAISHDGCEEEITELADRLKDVVVRHLHTEENLMDCRSYPDKETHLIEHGQFATLLTFIPLHGDISLTFDEISVIKTWILRHINETDRKLAEFLADEGEK